MQPPSKFSHTIFLGQFGTVAVNGPKMTEDCRTHGVKGLHPQRRGNPEGLEYHTETSKQPPDEDKAAAPVVETLDANTSPI